MQLIKDVISSLTEIGAEYNKMTDTKVLIAKLAELNKQIDAILDKGIEEFLTDYKDSELPFFILVQGETPLWNDGEACEHYSSYYIGLDEIVWEEKQDMPVAEFLNPYFPELEDCISEVDFDWDYDTRKYTPRNVDLNMDRFAAAPASGSKEDKKLKEIMDELIVPALEKKYVTDYIVLITCHKGKIEIKHESYNPEW